MKTLENIQDLKKLLLNPYAIYTYDFAIFHKKTTNGEPLFLLIEIERKGLANFLNDDQGYESGISMYGHYIACKSLDISSKEGILSKQDTFS